MACHFAAADARIGAAVLGMWGRITRIAPCLLSGPDLLNVPCYFCINQRIAFLPWRGGLEIYRSLPGQDKRFMMHEGPHTAATPEQTNLATRFLVERLTIGSKHESNWN